MEQSAERVRPLYDRLLKVVIVGVSGVGKSELFLQWTDSRFLGMHEPTIGVEFGTRLIQCGAEKTKLQIWDIAGDEEMQDVTRSYYQDADIVLCVWEANNDKSITAFDGILSDVATSAKKGAVVVFVRNKKDSDNLITPALLKERSEKVEATAKTAFGTYGFSGCTMIDSSAKDQGGIKELVNAVVQSALEIQKKEPLEEPQTQQQEGRQLVVAAEKPSRYQTIFNHSRDTRKANIQASNDETWLLLQWQSMKKGETLGEIKTKLILMQANYADDEAIQRAAELVCLLHHVPATLLRELDDDERGFVDKGRKFVSSFFDEPTESARAIEERRGIMLKLAARIYKKEENIYEGIDPKKIPPKVDDILRSNGLGFRK